MGQEWRMHLDYEKFHLFVGIQSAIHNFTTCLCLLSLTSPPLEGGFASNSHRYLPLYLILQITVLCFFILCVLAIKSSGGNQGVKLCEALWCISCAFWWCSLYVPKWCLAAPFYYCYRNPISLLIVFGSVFLPESDLSLLLLVSVCIDHLSSCSPEISFNSLEVMNAWGQECNAL